MSDLLALPCPMFVLGQPQGNQRPLLTLQKGPPLNQPTIRFRHPEVCRGIQAFKKPRATLQNLKKGCPWFCFSLCILYFSFPLAHPFLHPSADLGMTEGCIPPLSHTYFHSPRSRRISHLLPHAHLSPHAPQVPSLVPSSAFILDGSAPRIKRASAGRGERCAEKVGRKPYHGKCPLSTPLWIPRQTSG